MASIGNHEDLGIKLASIADAKTDYADDGSANDLDSDAKRVVAMNATNTTINSIILALEKVGILTPN